jgi:hypothetical protein
VFSVLRVIVGAGGALFVVVGIVLVVQGIPLFSLILVGLVAIVAAIWERTRYRSQAAERGDARPGPGGGETEQVLEPRFRPTTEVFVDPSTRRLMRVWTDPASGERRYRAEG